MSNDIPPEFRSQGRYVCLRDLEGTRDVLYSEIEALRREMDLHFSLMDKALEKASLEMNRRLEGMNEFRAQLSSQAANFLTKDRFEGMHSEYGKRIEELENFKSNINGRIAAAVVLLAAVGTLMGLLFHWIKP